MPRVRCVVHWFSVSASHLRMPFSVVGPASGACSADTRSSSTAASLHPTLVEVSGQPGLLLVSCGHGDLAAVRWRDGEAAPAPTCSRCCENVPRLPPFQLLAACRRDEEASTRAVVWWVDVVDRRSCAVVAVLELLIGTEGEEFGMTVAGVHRLQVCPGGGLRLEEGGVGRNAFSSFYWFEVGGTMSCPGTAGSKL